MATPIELLSSLQRLDQGIHAKKREAGEAARQLQALEEAVQQGAADAKRLREEYAEAKARQIKTERELAEVEDRMKDRRMRLQRIRSEKELQATQREIDHLKERIAQLEEAELQVLEETETLGAKLSAAESSLQDGEHVLELERATLIACESTLVQEIDRDGGARMEIAQKLDEELRRRYELLFARRGGMAVVAVRNGTCQGCHMHVPPQLFNQILKGERVLDCPNCQRILFPHLDTDETSES